MPGRPPIDTLTLLGMAAGLATDALAGGVVLIGIGLNGRIAR
jgi:hypothetical protein